MFAGRRLLLAGTQLSWFWIGAGAVALVLILLLYREQRRLVSRRMGLVLLSLRLVAALVLILALFEPIAARSYREEVKGRVIVAVDVSESMATVDRDRPREETSRLAKVLGIRPEDQTQSLSRREIARRLMDGETSPLSRVAKAHTVEVVSFARDMALGSLPDLNASLKKPAPPNDPSTETTDWQPALAEALKDADTPMLGVVLVTDGKRNALGDTAATIDRLSARGIPVYPVMVGSATPPRDAAIASIKAPEGVYKGDVANIEATLKLDGYAGREVAVTLERPGASPLRRTARVPEDGSRPVVSFRVPMDEVGLVPLSIAVPPLEGDARPDNDRRTVSIQVADDKARVLLVDGEARWEFRYLRNALTRDPHVEVDSLVFHQPETLGGASQTNYGNTFPLEPDPTANQPDPLGGFDAIFLGDVAPSDLAPKAWARLEAYVADRGGTLIFAPGPRHWNALAANEVARKLLPIEDVAPEAVDPSARDLEHPSLPPGIPVVLTAAGSDATTWPMLQFASDPEQNRAVWSGLPRLPWLVSGKPKPGASALASGREPDRAVVATQAYGLGKVLWVGSDATWRWRYRVGDAYHHRFWGQVVRWAASGKLMAGNAYVRFGPVRPKIAESESVTIQARVAEGVPGIHSNVLVVAKVFRNDLKSNRPTGEAVAVVPLRPVPGQPRAFEGTAPPLPIGTYLVRLDVPQLAAALHLDREPIPQAPLDVTLRETSERIELAADRDPLDRLATATGGRVFADYEADQLPSQVRSRTRQVTHTEETPLWDQPAALILFFTILTVEWVLRKRAGLP